VADRGAPDASHAAMSGRRGWQTAAVFAVAAGWFGLGSRLTLEAVDEGHLLYLAARVADGAVPNRDFHHLYPPGVFLLNGALFRVFGVDAAVLHTSLVLLKAAIVALVHALSLRVAPPLIAAGAIALLTAVWGWPLWVLNAPYANHYVLAGVLVALLAVLRARPGALAPALVAGLCLGVAATFKHTGALLGTLAVALFLAFELAGRGLFFRVLVAGAVLAVCGSCAARGIPLAMSATVLAPFAVAAVGVGAGVLRAPTTSWTTAAVWRAAVAVGVGFAAPIAAGLVALASAGGLAGLFQDVVVLPGLLTWLVPFPPLTIDVVIVLLLAGAGAAGVVVSRPGGTAGARMLVGAAAAVLLGALVSRGARWDVLALGALPWGAVLLVWLSLARLLRVRASGAFDERERAAALLGFTGAAMLVALYPSADLFHVVMGLPAFVPLLAFHLGRLTHDGGRGALPAFVLTLALAVGFGGPLVGRLLNERAAAPPPRQAFQARASGFRAARTPAERDLVAVMELVEREAAPGQEVLVVPNLQLLNFLTGRNDPLEADGWTLYLLQYDLLPPAAAAMLVDQTAMIAALEARRPLLVIDRAARGTTRMATSLPALQAHLDRAFHRVGSAGRYELWAPGGAQASPRG